ncbi:MAG: SIS domain-containing protein [Candidatus Paracaedibacteraceae bacterium]|nr:SIS domain-containing protein [Candidatus Paracaedibacteraceae bacterium]
MPNNASLEKKYIPPSDPKARIYELFNQSLALKQKVIDGGYLDILLPIGQMIADQITKGGKIFFCGNGGSAADAQHLAAELLVRLRSPVERRSIPAIALAMDTSTLTACGNDYSFDAIFARSLSGLGRNGDVILGLTTSGKSPNVIEAFKVAREMGIKTVGFLGGATGGEPALSFCDAAFVVPSFDTARIQEVHITAGHALMELVEDILILNNYC